MTMTDNEIRQEIELSELASEEKAVYNLDKIRKLERQLDAAAEHRQRLTARMRDLERQNTKLERLIAKMDTRIKHLEAVVYDVGAPPDAGMLEGIQ